MPSLTVCMAAPAETETAIGILAEAARWLQSRGIPTWTPESLPPVIGPAVARGEVYLAWMDDQPVGTVSVQWSDLVFWGERPDDAGYIHKLATARAAAGQQVGARLLAWAENLIAERGRQYARLDCHAENPFINRFYRVAGYQVRGTVTLQGIPMNLCEKWLS